MVAKEIWDWAISRDNFISCSHIPGRDNEEADYKSRNISIYTEWKLKPSIFRFVCNKLEFFTKIDLFASRLNSQLPLFMSFRPDPDCIAVDAFLEDWKTIKFYAFPPFAIIPKVLQKVLFEKGRGILIAPLWPTQPWYKRLQDLTVKFVLLHSRTDLLSLPSDPGMVHPMANKLQLLACLIDGDIYN